MVLTPPTLHGEFFALQISLALERVQGGVQCSRADAVAVVRELLGEVYTADRFLRSVVKNVYLDEAGKELTYQPVVRHTAIQTASRCPAPETSP